MKRILFTLLLFGTLFVNSQVMFNTGSAEFDADLNIINSRGSHDFVSFRQDLSVSFGISVKKIDYMRTQLSMVPGEIYLSLEIARITRKPIDDILVVYKKEGSKGWGHIAKQVGIKPGSGEFHEMKNSASTKKKVAKGSDGRKGKKVAKKTKIS